MQRPSLLLLALGLSACSGSGTPGVAEGGARLSCALGGAAEFVPVCAVDRLSEGVLIFRHPDGAFRRFVLSADGRDLAVADGADEADLELVGEQMEVRVGGDRYRLPLPLDRPASAN